MDIKEKVSSVKEEVTLKEQLDQYLRYWPWFLLIVLITILLAFFYLRYATSSYETQASILIKDTNNSELSELATFEDMGLGGVGLSKSEFENEIEVLKSKKLANQVVEKLKLNISYYREGNIKSSEIYEHRPFTLKILSGVDSLYEPKYLFLKILSESQYELQEGEEGDTGVFNFGEKINLEFGSITVIPDTEQLQNILDSQQRDMLVSITTIDNAVLKLRNTIQIQAVNKNSSVIQLNLVSPNKSKAQAILNNLISAYNNDAIADRNLVARNTAEFIDQRLQIITEELDSVETNKVDFKQTRRLTDLQTEGQLFLENASDFRKRQLEIATQKELVNTVISDLNKAEIYKLIPANLGIEREGVSNLIQNYNELVIDRDRLLTSSTEQNPVVQNLTNQIEQLKNNVLESLGSIKTSIQIAEQDLNRQQTRIGSEISEMPSVEKELRDIVRQQDIKEALYLYLLQKREENAISLAVTTPKAKIVDSAYSSKDPVSPKTKIVYLGAIVIGLLIPFLIIYIKNLLDTKIHNRADLEKDIPQSPILGEIPELETKDRETIKINDRSVLAESFRILRTNLSYLLKGQKGENKQIIYVTSTIKGEGKTFVSFNLALTLNSTSKSVLLIGADIRNPQLHRYIDRPEGSKGLSEYLYDEKVDAHSVINKAEINRHEIDVILSGRIPPNPAELLMNDRFEELLNAVKNQYDYVIVDTAPTMLVTDTLLISQYADLTVYVSRAEYTDKKLLNYPKELIASNKLHNVAFVVNNVIQANFGYGTKYGYGYGVEQKTWFQNFKDKVLRRS